MHLENFILAHKPLFDKIAFLSRHTLILFRVFDLWVHKIEGYDFNLSKNLNVAVHKSLGYVDTLLQEKLSKY